ncbi:MAG TPA: g-type lysozyme inhibitor [Candidatus Kapabacteria bacterium]|nr:g-type lysozyme inhibitor [Candidatus Kapabacteria bacterium]
MRSPILIPPALAVLLLASVDAMAQTPQRIHFTKGATAGVVKGSIKGFAYKDYVIGAKAGQQMSVTLSSNNSYAVFVITSINGHANNMSETTEWDQTLSESGDYVVRVLMMRANARRKGAKTNYTLTVAIR